MLHYTHIIFQTETWLENNAFIDMDGCYWETEYDRNNYDEEEKYELNIRLDDNGSQSFHPRMCNDLVFHRIIYNNILWAAKEFINKKDDPEYFV